MVRGRGRDPVNTGFEGAFAVGAHPAGMAAAGVFGFCTQIGLQSFGAVPAGIVGFEAQTGTQPPGGVVAGMLGFS